MEKAKILVIDDNEAVLTTLRLVLRSAFTTVVAVSNPQLIPALIREGDVDAVLLDMNFAPRQSERGKGFKLEEARRAGLDGQAGLFWLERILRRSNLENPPAVVMITAFGDVELAVESLKRGADDFVQKPWDNERLIQVLHDAIVKRDLRMSAVSVAKESENPEPASEGEDSPETLEEMERLHIRRVLNECNHNFQEAATRLGISRQTLYNKMKKWNNSIKK